MISSFDLHFWNSKSELQKCDDEMAAGRLPNFDTLLSGLRRILPDQISWYTDYFKQLDDLSSRTPTALTNWSFWWLEQVQILLNHSERCLNEHRHRNVCAFLRASLGSSNQANPILYEFHSTFAILRSGVSLLSSLSVEMYSDLLQEIGKLDGTEKDLRRGHNTDVLELVLPLLFPMAGDSESRPYISLAAADTLISHFSACLSDPEAFAVASAQCHSCHLFGALTGYLLAGCPGSSNAETTLEVMCGLDHWVTLDSVDLEFLLSWIQSLPHPLPTAFALIKYHALRALVNKHCRIRNDRLEKEGILGYAPESQDDFEAKMRLLRRDPERELVKIPLLSRAVSENMPPTQADWDTSYSFLSHPLLSTSSLDNVLEADPNFDFRACDDDVERGAQYLNLLGFPTPQGSFTPNSLKPAVPRRCHTWRLEQCNRLRGIRWAPGRPLLIQITKLV
ncbi:hypothetical protein DFH07DRAFT_343703 [Mycena maculata]|uniref:Uncharacterized protein n=1 Tax=Mycena maculata TaxID=230809 RepID=A0AAD7NMA3_9AGAR|nr:hypothetical protein DFH07DRAFT_343703 [Mycena maculata]